MPDIQVNVARYTEDKKLGISRMIKLNGQVFYTAKEFDRAGRPVVVNAPIAVESLKDVITNLDREIAEKTSARASALDMIADAETAQEVLP